MKRFAAAVALSLSLLAALAPAAGAGAEWCDYDPVVIVTTPGGSRVPIYLLNGALGVEHLPAVIAARINYTAMPARNGAATAVNLDVLIPGDQFAFTFDTRSKATTGPLATGTLLASTVGTSNQVMRLSFELNVP